MISTSRTRRRRLETARRQFDQWRQTRAHTRAPLPARLWATAVALVPAHGLYGTARALGVSYGALKQHVDRHDDAPRARRRARFVELPTASVTAEYVIEIARAAGTTVRVRLTGVPLSEVADFTRRVAGVAS
ncbi:MAG: hypothetical protein ACT4QD_23575 [Acidobacteriota bacterium]